MSANRFLYVSIFLAVALVAAIALEPAIVSKALTQQQSPQSLKGGRPSLSAHADALNDIKPVDRSYDQVETERGSQVGLKFAGKSAPLYRGSGGQAGPAGLDNTGEIDSATRSYMAWAKAVEEQKLASKADRSYDQIETERSLLVGDRSYDLIEAERGSQVGLTLAKVDRSFHTPQTSNYGPAQHSPECLDNECSYRLANGQPVK